MLILTHVILALSALALSAGANLRPSKNKLKISYGLAAGTLTSGVLLIVLNNVSIIRTCVTGIVFFGLVTFLNELARRKMILQSEQI